MKKEITILANAPSSKKMAIPSFLSHVQAGFPSPADDYVENQLDLNDLIIQHPAATFFVRVEGNSMIDANIQSGDILVVDRSVEAKSGKIVVCIVNGDFTVKRLIVNTSGAWLYAENPKFPPMRVDPNSDFKVWGVVTYVIHKAK